MNETGQGRYQREHEVGVAPHDGTGAVRLHGDRPLQAHVAARLAQRLEHRAAREVEQEAVPAKKRDYYGSTGCPNAPS